MTSTLEQVRDWHLEEVRRLNSYRHPFPNDSTVLAALIMHHQSMADAIDAHIAGMGEPVAYQSKRRPEDYPDEWRECSKETFDTIKRVKDSPWIVRELFDRPPVQAAQVEDEDMDAQLTVMIEHLTSIVESQAAEPVAQADQVGELLAIIHGDGGHYQAEHGLQKAAKDAQEKVIQMMTKLAAAPQPGEPS